MPHQLKILLVASEVVPFAKTGGLADVAGILPKYLKKLGHDVRVVMPRYYAVDPSKYQNLGFPLGVPMGVIGEQWCGVLEGRLPNSDVPIYFIDHQDYFGRDAIYNDQSGKGFMDNDNRFVFLSRASLQLAKALDFKADVVHVHDWQTAAIPVFLNTHYKNDEHLGRAASVLTIHNMQYQGAFYEGLMDVLGVGWEHFHYQNLEWKNMVNLLKGGINHCTQFNAVSHGYAREIQTKEYGWGLEGTVRDQSFKLRGILNGMDYEEWDPSADKYLSSNYDVGDMAGKAKCKEDLQNRFGLPLRPDVPIIGTVTRLVEQKGINFVAEAIHNILGMDVQMVLLGNGDPWAHFFFGDVATWYPEKFRCYIGYNNELAHKIEAGSDFFLMPSSFEPCGLNQMYSLRYGTPPIVRATGGLDDTVENFNEGDNSGTGFKFWDLNAKSLVDTVGWAVSTYYNNKDGLKKLIENGMQKRFSWEDSAKEYERIYLDAISIKSSQL